MEIEFEIVIAQEKMFDQCEPAGLDTFLITGILEDGELTVLSAECEDFARDGMDIPQETREEISGFYKRGNYIF